MTLHAVEPTEPSSRLLAGLTAGCALFALLLYVGTLGHGFVYDDRLVYTDHQDVRKGLAGIPGIFTADSYEGFYKTHRLKNHLVGGRYRPLSLATFALEVEWAGGLNPRLGHAVNVLLYALTTGLIFRVLWCWFFRRQPWVALAITLLFATHPLHTEVVCNIKSRDELLSLFFILGSLHFGLSWLTRSGVQRLIGASLCFGFGLFAKEYTLLLLVSFPLTAWILGLHPKRSLLILITAWLLVSGGFLVVRTAAIHSGDVELADVNTNPLDNPFLKAETSAQVFATKVDALLTDLKLLIVPYPLRYDYSYAQVPYTRLSDVRFWMGMSVYVGLSMLALWGTWRRKLWAWGLLFLLSNLLIISNLLVATGILIGERFLYHASLGFCFVIGCLMRKPLQGGDGARVAAWTGLFLVFFAFSTLTLLRNPAWKSEYSLFVGDLRKAPNSARVNNNAAVMLERRSRAAQNPIERRALLQRAIAAGEKAVAIYPDYLDGRLNLARFYLEVNDLEQAETHLDHMSPLIPDHPKLKARRLTLSTRACNRGIELAARENWIEARKNLRRAVRNNPGNQLAWKHLSEVLTELGETEEAEASKRKAK